MKSLEYIKSFSCFRNVDHLAERHPVLKSVQEPAQVHEDDSILALVFAPDPTTGHPSSDLSFYMSERTAPEIKDYIKRNLMRELPHRAGSPDDDTAIEHTVPRAAQYGAECREFMDNLRNFVDSFNKKADE